MDDGAGFVVRPPCHKEMYHALPDGEKSKIEMMGEMQGRR
jgi:hypothetical protein